MIRVVAIVVMLALTLPGHGAWADPAATFDAQGYRNASYRAVVDRDPVPARRITLAEARRLHAANKALFIDVLPAEGANRDPVSGRWTLATRHQSIPGALWLPDTGRAAPDAVMWRGLEARVAAHRQRHRRAAVVVFCRADCWLSWNAARRLALSGERNVRWLAEGIEGWHETGGSLVDAQPEAVPNPGP